MVEPLTITQDMRDAHTKRVDEKIEKQNRSISLARERGRCETLFCIYKGDPDYYEVKAKFESAGYRIKPTGYIDGVWQLTEEICW